MAPLCTTGSVTFTSSDIASILTIIHLTIVFHLFSVTKYAMQGCYEPVVYPMMLQAEGE